MIFEITYRTPARATRTVLFTASSFDEALAYAKTLKEPLCLKFDIIRQKNFELELKKNAEDAALLAKEAK